MNKKNFFSKTMMMVLTVSMSVFIFAGCQSKATNGAAQASNTSTQNAKKPDPAQMKKRMQDSIQPLITDGTITQAQADKIVEAFTTNTHKGSSQGNGQNNQNDNTQSNPANGNKNNGQNKGRSSALAKLVTDGVITQAQSDAVMKKMGGNFAHKNNGQGSNNNGQSSNDNGQTSTQQ